MIERKNMLLCKPPSNDQSIKAYSVNEWLIFVVSTPSNVQITQLVVRCRNIGYHSDLVGLLGHSRLLGFVLCCCLALEWHTRHVSTEMAHSISRMTSRRQVFTSTISSAVLMVVLYVNSFSFNNVDYLCTLYLADLNTCAGARDWLKGQCVLDSHRLIYLSISLSKSPNLQCSFVRCATKSANNSPSLWMNTFVWLYLSIAPYCLYIARKRCRDITHTSVYHHIKVTILRISSSILPKQAESAGYISGFYRSQ